MKTSLDDITKLVDGERIGGSPHTIITDIAEVRSAGETEITFVGNSKYYQYLSDSTAGAVIVSREYDGSFEPRVVVENPQLAVKQLIDHFRPPSKPDFTGIHETAIIHPSAHVGKGVTIGAYVVVEPEVTIGDNCILGNYVSIGSDSSVGAGTVLYPSVTVYDKTIIGRDVIIHSGTVIGCDGYGFTEHEGKHVKIRQVGRVRIEDEVEIGANCTIDRGSLGETVIGAGSKLDNLIHIAHNCKIGQGCLLTALVGIAGSTQLGNFVVAGGQSGFIGHITVGDQVTVASKAGVTKDIASGLTISGFPAAPHGEKQREKAMIRRLPDLFKRIRELEKTIETLSGKEQTE